MPSYSRRSRSALLGLSRALISAARRQRPEPGVAEAADAAELALLELEAAILGRRSAGAPVSDAAAAALAAEDSLDRRCRGLHAALRGLAQMGDGEAEHAADRLFPDGPGRMFSPQGRAQAAEYRLLADALDALAGDPALARFAPHVDGLVIDLRAFVGALDAKDGVRADELRASRGAAAAAAALEDAMQQLDRVISAACGGPRSEGYLAWAAVAQGLG